MLNFDTLRGSLQTSFQTSREELLWALLTAALAGGLLLGALLGFVGPILTFAALVGLAGGLLMLRSMLWGLIALIGIAVLLPFGVLPVKIGLQPTFLDAATLAVFGVWFVSAMAQSGERRLRFPVLGWLVALFVCLVLLAFVAGLAHSGLDKNTLRRFLELVLSILLYFVVTDGIRERRQIEWVVRVLILAGTASALMGIILYFLPQNVSIRLLSTLRVVGYPAGSGVLRFIEDNPQLAQRAISTSVDPNVFGGLLILVAALTAPQLVAPRPLFPRRFVAVSLTAMSVAMLLTFSRSAMLGLLVALAVIGTVRYRRWVPLVVLTLIVILFMPQTQGYVQHFAAGLRGEDLATQMRFGEYKDAWILIQRYPLFGVGFVSTPDIDIYIGVSSVYLLMAEEMGLVGLSIFLVIMAVFFGWAVRVLRTVRDPALEPILLGLVAALCGAMVGGLFDHYFFNLSFPHASTLYWLFVALGSSSILAMSESPET
jgi:O-antigen ligase